MSAAGLFIPLAMGADLKKVLSANEKKAKTMVCDTFCDKQLENDVSIIEYQLVLIEMFIEKVEHFFGHDDDLGNVDHWWWFLEIYFDVVTAYPFEHSKDWTLRYFAAQTYVELYGLTGDQAYLQEAYSIALNNVNYLIDDQKALNAEYLAAIKEASEPAGATDTEKKEIKQYNKLLKEERKKELPRYTNLCC